MQKKFLTLSVIAAGLVLFAGCGGGGNSDDLTNNTTKTLYKLSPQTGTQNYLFYGETNPESLGSLNNVRVIDSANPGKVLIENNNTSDVRSPVVTTHLEYNTTNNTYSNFFVDTLGYVSNGTAYVVNMKKGENAPVQIQNSSAVHLSNPSYTEINYLGMHQYLIAHDDDANQTVLITPDMAANNAPIIFGDKELLSLTYAAYGDAPNGYLVYDNTAKEVQKCTQDMTSCTKIDFGVNVGSRDFEDDLAGTTYSIFIIDDTFYRLDKANNNIEKVDFNQTTIDRTYIQGTDLYVVGDDHNIYRINMLTKAINKVTPEADDRIERIRAWTDNYIIYGSDTLFLAAKKDGTSKEPVKLAETTKTSGYKYVKEYGIGNEFLLQLYSIDTKTNDTRYKACIFNDGNISCKNDAFWVGVALKKEGKLDLKSSINYEPYAYIRVDDTDNFGGGTLKAIDPAHPLDDGIAMGKAPNYNFQTFLTNSSSRYLNAIVDDNGGVVFYAKNDTNFHVDAFYMNLLQENSLIQLTNTDPFPGVNTGRDHCHGRHCMICHNFAGGKIYTEINSTKSAYGYRVRLDFEDGRQLLADIAKGKGENFSLPLKDLTGNFNPVVIDQNGTIVNESDGYYHEGVEYANCNYCHARYGKMKYGAPGVIGAKQ